MTRSTINVTFGGEDLDPAALIGTAAALRAAIDRANALPPAARVAIAQSEMGQAARELAEGLARLATTTPADDPGELAIPPTQPLGVEILHVYDGAFSIPLGGGQAIQGEQKAIWIIKRVAGGALQAHAVNGEVREWAADPAQWDQSKPPTDDPLWQIIG